MTNQDCIIQVFAKAPIEGYCKTRLAKDIGDQKAATYHARMVEDTVSRLEGYYNLQLWCKPSCGHPFFQVMKTKYSASVFNQHGDSLGEIMDNAAKQAMENNFTSLMQIGTDCPWLDHAYIKQAQLALDNTDLVIGPANDGGYVLLAQKTHHANLYRDIEWGTSKVLNQLESNISKQNLKYNLLDSLPDIDTLDDLKLIMTGKSQLDISQ